VTNLHYAIGDIHGDLEKLEQILARIDKDLSEQGNPDHKIIFIGDLVDRRAYSAQVVEKLRVGIQNGAPWIVLKGNHDRMFSLFFTDAHKQDHKLLERGKDLFWLHSRLGGLATLASYGVDTQTDQDPERLQKEALIKVPTAHRDFLENLPSHYETDHFFFAHAGVNPEFALAHQKEDDLIWIREPFLEHSGGYSKVIIHGHSPVEKVTHYGNRINIDTGAAYGNALSAIALDSHEIFELTETGRVFLRANFL